MAGATLSRHSKESVFGQGFAGSLAAGGVGGASTIPTTSASNKPIRAEVVMAKDGCGRLWATGRGDRGCVWHTWCAHNFLAMVQNNGNLLT